MKEGGSLVKINKKGDTKIGQSIYCFEDDLYIEKVVSKGSCLIALASACEFTLAVSLIVSLLA